MSDFPTEYHIVDVAGTRHFIDAETRKELEVWCRRDSDEMITVDGILGDEITIMRGSVRSIWSSVPETRRREREFNKQINDEIPVEERE